MGSFKSLDCSPPTIADRGIKAGVAPDLSWPDMHFKSGREPGLEPDFVGTTLNSTAVDKDCSVRPVISNH